ncbi:MAG: hypothetical protein WD342_17635 [Verrucomicrobiales bacterium]
MTLSLPKWFDLHAHFRQGPNVASYIEDHLAMGCAGALAMPNTQPPVSRVSGERNEGAWSIESYRDDLLSAGAEAFEELIVPLYLTGETTSRMIDEGAASGQLRACKYYPPHGTTNAEHGVPMAQWIGSDVFRAMEEHGIVLCVHGEEHGLSGSAYFDEKQSAESLFYSETFPRVIEAHPRLKIVCEHVTTTEAVAFVGGASDRVGATITPQHLLYTVGHLLQGLRYHLYCLPLVKFERDREALRAAVTNPGQRKFFAGTDSAPHTAKATAFGCAAGCYTGGCAPQLYAMAFEEAGADLAGETGLDAFTAFLCANGPAFYGFAGSDQRFELLKKRSTTRTSTRAEGRVTPLPAGMNTDLAWTIVS